MKRKLPFSVTQLPLRNLLALQRSFSVSHLKIFRFRATQLFRGNGIKVWSQACRLRWQWPLAQRKHRMAVQNQVCELDNQSYTCRHSVSRIEFSNLGLSRWLALQQLGLHNLHWIIYTEWIRGAYMQHWETHALPPHPLPYAAESYLLDRCYTDSPVCKM